MLGRVTVVLVPDARSSALMLSPYRVIAIDVKSCNYCCYVNGATLIVRLGGMLWLQRIAFHYNAQLGLLDKGRVIKGFFLYYCIEVWLRSKIYVMWLWVWLLAQGAWSGPLLWLGWLSSSGTATPRRFI